MERYDPIGEKYYRPLALAEKLSSFSFWAAAILSIATLFSTTNPWNDWLKIAFVVFVVANFILGFTIRLWLSPRADEHRRLDLLSNSFDVKLTHENAVGYFNNSEKSPILRLALSVTESIFFTKNIVGKMLLWERGKIVAYSFLWLICVINRASDLSLIIVGTQVLFSEQIISKWLRMEYLYRRSDVLYQKFHLLFTTAKSFNNASSHAQVLGGFSEYEAAKARASIGLSTRIFKQNNSKLSKEWDDIRASLNFK